MSLGEDLPYAARTLSKRERDKLDVYTFRSPKCARTVQIVGTVAFSQALLLEFNVDVSIFVERPRRITYGDRTGDISYWYRLADGQEKYLLLVPTPDTEALAGGRRQHRHIEQLQEAARAIGIAIELKFEPEILAEAARIATFFHLLPFVQTALRLNNRMPLQQDIAAFVERHPRCSLSQVEAALSEYRVDDVRAVTCDLIHAGCVEIDAASVLHAHTTITTGRKSRGQA